MKNLKEMQIFKVTDFLRSMKTVMDTAVSDGCIVRTNPSKNGAREDVVMMSVKEFERRLKP